MNMALICVGRLKERYWRDAAAALLLVIAEQVTAVVAAGGQA